MMPYVLGIVKVEDFAKWKSGFSAPEGEAMREEAGIHSYQVFQLEGDPNKVFILLKCESLESARNYYQSEKFQEAQVDAGVLGQPEMYYLEEAKEGP